MNALERYRLRSQASQDGWRSRNLNHMYRAAFDSLGTEMQPDPEYPFLLSQRSAALVAYAARNVVSSPAA